MSIQHNFLHLIDKSNISYDILNNLNLNLHNNHLNNYRLVD